MKNVGAGRFVREDRTGLVNIQPWQMSNQLMLNPFFLTVPLWIDSLDTRYGRETILSSRQCSLQIVLDPSMEIYRRWPWAKVDRLFFGPEDPDLGWGALKTVSQPPGDFLTDGGSQSLDFLPYVFGWAKPQSELPRYTVHRVNGAMNDRALEEMNGTAVTEEWNTCWVINRLVANNVPEHSVIVVGSEYSRSLVLTWNHSILEDRRIWTNPFWRVELSWEVVPCEQIPQIIDRRWKYMDWGSNWRAPWNERRSSSPE